MHCRRTSERCGRLRKPFEATLENVPTYVTQLRSWSAGNAQPGPADGDAFRLFALRATIVLGTRIATALEQSLASHEERDFEDGVT